MNKTLLTVLCAAALLCTTGDGWCENVFVRGSRVSIEKPDGFEESKDFSGFKQTDTQSSILVTELPAPYSLTTAGFNAAGLASRGMKLLSKADVQLGGYPGQLVEVEQSAYGIVFRKWLTAFGDNETTLIVTGAFPLEKAETLSAKMKNAVLSARYDKQLKIADPIDNLPFTVSTTANLKFAGVIQNTLMMNASGELTKPATGRSSVFVVGKALGSLPVADKAAFTRARLHKTDRIADIEIISEKDVEIAALPGREIVASANEKDGSKVLIFLTMIFPPDTYFILQGMADLADREKIEPEFRTVTNSFKLKP